MTSCSNESTNSPEDKILEEINLVCEGENTFKRDFEWQFTEPEKKVYRFVRTASASYLHGFFPGEDNYYSVYITEDEISLTWESNKDERGWSQYQNIRINRFTGDVRDWRVNKANMIMENTFEGSCMAQDQKF